MSSSLAVLARSTSLLCGCCAALSIAGAEDGNAFHCTVEEAVFITDDGKSADLEGAPVAFKFTIRGSSADPAALRNQPLRKLDAYEGGETLTASASIDEKLFSDSTADLRSRDGVVFVEGSSVFQFVGEGRFTATGRMSNPAEGEGVAVYFGSCAKS